MKATVVDMRYKMKDVLASLERNEDVTLLYHGKVKGFIRPAGRATPGKVSEHAFFGMSRSARASVAAGMESLRGGRRRTVLTIPNGSATIR